MTYLAPVSLSFQPAFGLLSPAAQRAIAQADQHRMSSTKELSLRQLGKDLGNNFLRNLPYSLSIAAWYLLVDSFVKNRAKSNILFFTGAVALGLTFGVMQRLKKQQLDAFLKKAAERHPLHLMG